MVRRRMIDPSIWEDENFGSLSDKAKILFISCFSNADDDGRLSGHSAHLRAITFQYSSISLAKVEKLLNEIAEKLPNFSVYEKNSRKYVEFVKWNEYQIQREDRRKPSKIPANDNQPSTNCQPDVCLSKVKLSKDKISKVSSTFKDIWERYPKKVGRKKAEGYFESSVKTTEDFTKINLALDHYLKSERVAKGFVQNGATWFNDWETWVDYQEPVCFKCQGRGKYVSPTGYEITCDCKSKGGRWIKP